MNTTDTQTMPPLVSVIIPTLNRGKYIRQCIESALSQDYPNLEVIVVDNGSTDNTPEILSSFGDEIKCLKEEKRGVCAARNKGLRAARGEFIGLLDDDDFYLPGKISFSVKKLLENLSASLVYTDFVMVNPDGRQIKNVKMDCPQPKEFLRTFLGGFCILPSTTLLRKECLENIGYFDETFLYGHEDTDMWLRMLRFGYHFEHIPKSLTAYRQHPENHSFVNNRKEETRLRWDKICSSAIEDCAVRELFGDLVEKKGWKRRVKREYDKLADTCYFRHFALSARAAAEKSLELGRPLFFSLFLTNIWQSLPILCSILDNTLKIILSSLASLNPKKTRQNTGSYRRKINKSFFKLRYRLFKVFFYRYGLNIKII